MRYVDWTRMPANPWLKSTTGKRPSATAASRAPAIVNVAGTLPFSSALIAGGTKSRTS